MRSRGSGKVVERGWWIPSISLGNYTGPENDIVLNGSWGCQRSLNTWPPKYSCQSLIESLNYTTQSLWIRTKDQYYTYHKRFTDHTLISVSGAPKEERKEATIHEPIHRRIIGRVAFLILLLFFAFHKHRSPLQARYSIPSPWKLREQNRDIYEWETKYSRKHKAWLGWLWRLRQETLCGVSPTHSNRWETPGVWDTRERWHHCSIQETKNPVHEIVHIPTLPLYWGYRDEYTEDCLLQRDTLVLAISESEVHVFCQWLARHELVMAGKW